jgi:molecular chaperone HscA
MNARNLAEDRVDGQRLVEATEAALAENGDLLLSTDERAAIEQRIAALKTALAGNELAAVKRATDTLNHATGDFAARRMDASVKRALTGHRLDELEI